MKDLELWKFAGELLGEVPPEYGFLQAFVLVMLVFMLFMFIYSAPMILACVINAFRRKR